MDDKNKVNIISEILMQYLISHAKKDGYDKNNLQCNSICLKIKLIEHITCKLQEKMKYNQILALPVTTASVGNGWKSGVTKLWEMLSEQVVGSTSEESTVSQERI